MNLKQKIMLMTTIASAIAISMLTFTANALGLSQEPTTDGGFSPEAGKFIGAGLAVGLAGFGSSIGMGSAASAARLPRPAALAGLPTNYRSSWRECDCWRRKS